MKYILVLPIGLFVFVILPIAGYTLVAIATYNNTIIQNFKIAFLVYAVNPFKVIMFTLLVLIFFGIRLIPLGIYFQAIFEVIGYVLLPVSLIIFFLFTNKQFDKNINEKYYPELLNKGIYKLK